MPKLNQYGYVGHMVRKPLNWKNVSNKLTTVCGIYVNINNVWDKGISNITCENCKRTKEYQRRINA